MKINVKTISSFFILLISLCNCHNSYKNEFSNSNYQFNDQEIHTGDIIFQTSKSSQSKAIQLATNSPYSHMGIIFESKGRFYVFEAESKVKFTSLEKFITRGVGGSFVVKRLKNGKNLLTANVILKMKKIGENYLNKPYDAYFSWDEDKLYCSELVWKIYKKSININIGELQKFSEFDTSSFVVKKIMHKNLKIICLLMSWLFLLLECLSQNY